MKKVLTFMAVIFSCTAFGQMKLTVRENGKDTVLTNINSIQSFFNQSATVSKDKMPNALSGYVDKQQMKGNNQQGFDIYKSQTDNMPVLKLDATNLASLSNNNAFVYKPVEVSVIPDLFIPKLNNNLNLPKPKKLKLDKLPLSPQ